MKQIIALLLLSCFSWDMAAQQVNLADIHFSNDFEKRAFEDLEKGEGSPFRLLVASSGNVTETDFESYRLRLQQFIEELKPEKMERYSGKKKVRKIFDAVQDNWLVKYQYENRFADLLKNGYFNCVSSTALHALLLERFNVPYTITEEPQHVYLVAQPENENIVMEGTNPVGGYQRITDRLVQAQLQMLVNQKVITEQELRSPDLGSVLDELFPQKNIDLLELVSVQYYNQAIYDFEKSEYFTAYQNALKAYYISPNERFRNVLHSASLTWLAQRDVSSSHYPDIMAVFAVTDTTEEHYDIVAQEFGAVGYAMLFEEREPAKLDSLYNRLKRRFRPSYLVEKTDFAYHALKADYAFKLGLFHDGYKHSYNAMLLEPENLEVAGMLLANTGQLVHAQKFGKASDSLKSLSRQFPILAENNIWCSMYAEQLLYDIWNDLGDSYNNKVGDKVAEFEELMADPNLIVSRELIGSTYSRLALMRFNSSKARARETLAKALQWAPDDSNLLRVKRMLGV